MKANAVPLLGLFERKLRLEVPLFQRQYVWSREQQWEPLWEDIARKFTEYLEGRKDSPVHFLGAMVLDQKMTPSTHVEKRQVIDGQQRLTTLQIVLAALRDFCREHGLEDHAREFRTHTLNSGMMADPEVDQFKVWPTRLDRRHFTDVLSLGSREAIEAAYPLTRKKWARYYDPRPRIIEAYLYFDDQIREFFLGTDGEEPLCAEVPLEARIDEAFQALKNALQVVAIDLEQGDDAQVIFETLNARGEPLLPADLLRNYVFLRAARLGENTETLYAKYWSHFDDDFWREEVRQGRLRRPRSDLFMQHFLSSRQMVDIPIKHLFVEYRHWIEKTEPFASVEDELFTLSEQGGHFRRIIQPEKGDPICRLATFLEDFDIRTAYPFLLYLLDEELDAQAWREITVIMESYLLRRAVMGWTTKNYNKVFLNLVKTLRMNGPTPDALQTALSVLSGPSAGWPTDEEFFDAWMSGLAYESLTNAKLVHILLTLSAAYLTKKNERIAVDGPLTIEHILPQQWIEHWPLPGGERGLNRTALMRSDDEDPIAEATWKREGLLQTFGNLTILTQALNSSVSNAAWKDKKLPLLRASLLPINQMLHEYPTWDEEAIHRRGRELFKEAARIWPAPTPECDEN